MTRWSKGPSSSSAASKGPSDQASSPSVKQPWPVVQHFAIIRWVSSLRVCWIAQFPSICNLFPYDFPPFPVHHFHIMWVTSMLFASTKKRQADEPETFRRLPLPGTEETAVEVTKLGTWVRMTMILMTIPVIFSKTARDTDSKFRTSLQHCWDTEFKPGHLVGDHVLHWSCMGLFMVSCMYLPRVWPSSIFGDICGHIRLIRAMLIVRLSSVCGSFFQSHANKLPCACGTISFHSNPNLTYG